MNTTSDHRRGKMMRAGYNIRDQFGVHRIGDRRLEYANDCGRALSRRTCLPITVGSR
jgi:hypothetical protein